MDSEKKISGDPQRTLGDPWIPHSGFLNKEGRRLDPVIHSYMEQPMIDTMLKAWNSAGAKTAAKPQPPGADYMLEE